MWERAVQDRDGANKSDRDKTRGLLIESPMNKVEKTTTTHNSIRKESQKSALSSMNIVCSMFI